MIYLFGFIVSLVIGYLFTRNLIDKDYKSKLSGLIKSLGALGISLTIFGVLFLVYHAIGKPFSPESNEGDKNKSGYNKSQKNDFKPEDLKEIILKEDEKTTKKYEVDSDFKVDTLEYNQKSVQTATIFFTIAGIALGSLGVFWLGHLESTRLKKDRKHDQEVQKDRLLSLLALGIDLFLYIDKEELDFVYEISDSEFQNKKYNSIKWKDKYYLLLSKDIIRDNEKLKLAQEKHLTSLCRFLYEQKNFKKNTILSDIHKIIEELKLIHYEKDIVLHYKSDDKYLEKREIFIKLLKQYSDYSNFLDGNTIESDFSVGDYESYEKKLSTLISTDASDNVSNPIEYLYNLYKKNKHTKTIFYEFFLEKVSKEFSYLYLVKESDIFSIFQVNNIKDIFEMMSFSNLESHKFFNSYFKDSFNKYIKEKKVYQFIDLKEKDLEFEEYLQIIDNTFLQINSDINSVKELYSLFYSFVKLYNNYDKEEDKYGN